MSQSLEDRLGRTLKHQRLHRLADERRHDPWAALDERHMEVLRRAQRFSTEIRSVFQEAVVHANSYFVRMGVGWELHDVSGCYTGPLYPCGGECNPIAYELRVDHRVAGETLIVELSPNGVVEAFLAPWRPPILEAHTGRIDFGWRPVELCRFDSDTAADILVRYVDRITARYGATWQRTPVPASARPVGEGAF